MARRTLAVLMLMALTVLLYAIVPRYVVSDRQLLGNADLARGLAGWRVEGAVWPDPMRPGAVVLESGDAADWALLYQTIEVGDVPPALFVRARIAAEVSRADDGYGGGAWLLVGGLVESEAVPYWQKGSYAPYLTVSSHGWRSVEAVFGTPPVDRAVTFGIGVQGAGVTLRAADLALFEAIEHPGFRIGRLALIVAWGLTALWVGASVYRSLGPTWARLALIPLIGAAIVGLLAPESAETYAGLPQADGLELIGHASLFFVLTLALRVSRPRDPLWLAFGGLALFAAASEVVQLFVPGRGPELYDWLADLAGIVAGLVLCRLPFRLGWETIRRIGVRGMDALRGNEQPR